MGWRGCGCPAMTARSSEAATALKISVERTLKAAWLTPTTRGAP